MGVLTSLPFYAVTINEKVTASFSIKKLAFDGLCQALIFLRTEEIINFSLVNRLYQQTCSSEKLWKIIAQRECPKQYAQELEVIPPKRSLQNLCKEVAHFKKNLIKHSYRETSFVFHEDNCIVTGNCHLDSNEKVMAVSYTLFSDQASGTSYRVGDIVKVWNLETGQKLYQLKPIASRVVSLKIDNEKLICCYEDCLIRIWELGSAALLSEFRLHHAPLAILSVKNAIAINAYADGVIHVWSSATSKITANLKGNTAAASCLARQATRIACGGVNGIHIWDFNADEMPSLTLQRHKGAVLSMDWAGDFLYSVGEDMTMRGWNALTQEQIFEIPFAHKAHLASLHMFGDIFITTSRKFGLEAWSLCDKSLVKSKLLRAYKMGVADSLAENSIQLVGSSLIWGGQNGAVRALNFRFRQPLSQRIRHSVSNSPVTREKIKRIVIIFFLSAVLIVPFIWAMTKLDPNS